MKIYCSQYHFLFGIPPASADILISLLSYMEEQMQTIFNICRTTQLGIFSFSLLAIYNLKDLRISMCKQPHLQCVQIKLIVGDMTLAIFILFLVWKLHISHVIKVMTPATVSLYKGNLYSNVKLHTRWSCSSTLTNPVCESCPTLPLLSLEKLYTLQNTSF